MEFEGAISKGSGGVLLERLELIVPPYPAAWSKARFNWVNGFPSTRRFYVHAVNVPRGCWVAL